jgi:hypothetical protein
MEKTMTTVNKILSALIFILGIACCIAAVLLHQRRIELRQRADYLAAVLERNAQALDGQGDSATELGVQKYITQKNLDWKSYHLALDENGKYTSWEKNAEQIVDGSEKLAAMKKDLAETIMDLAKAAEMDLPEETRNALNSVLTYSANSENILQRAKSIRERDDSLARALVEVSNALNKSMTESNFKVMGPELQSNVSGLVEQASALYSRRLQLANGLNELHTAFTADSDGEVLYNPSWKAVFNSEDPEEINRSFASLSKGLKELNLKLYELKVANKLMDEQRNQLVTQKNIIEEVNSENDRLKNLVGNRETEIARLNRTLENYKTLLPEEGVVFKQVEAKVLEANDRFNFIVIDKGRTSGLVANAMLIVHNDGTFICKVKVSKVLDGSAVCDILPSHGSLVANIPAVGSDAVTVNP